MSEIINLRLARKRKARADRETEADENRARHGRTKAERLLSRAEAEKTQKTLDGARREDIPE